MSDLVKSHHPVGTLQEIVDLGLNTDAVGSCAKRKQGEVRGCPYWNECIFRHKENGGFRGEGPKYIGYYLRTTEGNKKEDLIACFNFMGSLHDRMRAQDRTGEFVAIVAQEGDEITVKKTLATAPATPGGTGKLVTETLAIKVPKFPRPSEASAEDEYERTMTERRRELVLKRRLESEGLSTAEQKPERVKIEAPKEEDWTDAPKGKKRGAA